MKGRDCGRLDARVVIQQKTTTADSQGGRSVTWATLATVWADVQSVSGTEQLQARAVGSHVAYTVEIQHRTDVTATMRVQWTPYGASAARTLEIVGVREKPGADSYRLVLDCREVV